MSLYLFRIVNILQIIELVGAECLQIRGPIENVIIVKNGPSEGNWADDLEMDMEKVARTLWWYMKSGNDRAQVFGEREFARFIKSL